MRTYQKAIAGGLIVAGLAGLLGCKDDNSGRRYLQNNEPAVTETVQDAYRTEIVPLDELLKNISSEYQDNVFSGTLSGSKGAFVFDDEGFYRGFLNTNDTKFGGIIPGPDGKIVGVLLRDGTIQNPDGKRSSYTNPVEYLLKTVNPIKEPKYHISNIGK